MLCFQEIGTGWIYGAEDFVARLIDRLEKPAGEHHRARERRQTDEEIAERIVRAGMKELSWTEEELGRRRKSDVEKVRLAREVRSRTSVDLKWIARRLQMGTWTHVSNLLGKIDQCQK